MTEITKKFVNPDCFDNREHFVQLMVKGSLTHELPKKKNERVDLTYVYPEYIWATICELVNKWSSSINIAGLGSPTPVARMGTIWTTIQHEDGTVEYIELTHIVPGRIDSDERTVTFAVTINHNIHYTPDSETEDTHHE